MYWHCYIIAPSELTGMMKTFDQCCLYLQCIQYQTDQQSDVKKVEKLNNLFFGLMANGVEDSEGESMPQDPSPPKQQCATAWG